VTLPDRRSRPLTAQWAQSSKLAMRVHSRRPLHGVHRPYPLLEQGPGHQDTSAYGAPGRSLSNFLAVPWRHTQVALFELSIVVRAASSWTGTTSGSARWVGHHAQPPAAAVSTASQSEFDCYRRSKDSSRLPMRRQRKPHRCPLSILDHRSNLSTMPFDAPTFGITEILGPS
jgi:hypothetical protein